MNGRARNALVAMMATALGWGIADPAHAVRTQVIGDTLSIEASPGEINVLTVQGHPTRYGTFVVADAGATMTTGPGCTGVPLGRVALCAVPAGYDSNLSLSLGDGPDVATVSAVFADLTADSGTGDDRLDIPGETGETTRVQLGGGNDWLNIEGSYGWDVQVHGGDGDDQIDASAQDGGSYFGEGGDDTITASGLVSGGDGADMLVGTGMPTSSYFGDAGDDTIDTDDTSPDRIDCGPGTDALTHDDGDEFTGCETPG